VKAFMLFFAGVCVVAGGTASFATETDRAAASLRREGVTIGGGDGSSFDKAIIVHADSPRIALLAGYQYVLLRYRLWQFSSYRLSTYKTRYYFVVTYDDARMIGPFPNKTKRVVYFDMTDYYRRSRHSPQPTEKKLQR
jgi:hypothetical protein